MQATSATVSAALRSLQASAKNVGTKLSGARGQSSATTVPPTSKMPNPAGSGGGAGAGGGGQFFSSNDLRNASARAKQTSAKLAVANAGRGGSSGAGGGGGGSSGSNPFRNPLFTTMAAAGGLAAAAYNIDSESVIRYLDSKRYAKPHHEIFDESGYPKRPVPLRADQVKRLGEEEEFDLLIVGGGATGAGMAADAATRGLKTAMVEANDFASGTSSRSTKLAHGGVRYLEKAVKNFDYSQLHLVFEALSERKRLLNNAPHLSRSLPIMTPCYHWWEVPYYWAGMKAYDTLAGSQGLTWSRFMTSHEAKRQFPTLRTENVHQGTLKGSIVYYDGQFNDARLCLLLACTAAEEGAAVANYTEVVDLVKDKETGRVRGAKCHDKITGKTFEVRAKQVSRMETSNFSHLSFSHQPEASSGSQ